MEEVCHWGCSPRLCTPLYFRFAVYFMLVLRRCIDTLFPKLLLAMASDGQQKKQNKTNNNNKKKRLRNKVSSFVTALSLS